MAKIPINLVVDAAKTHGPKAIKFVEDHHKEIVAVAMPIIGAGTKIITDFQANRKDKKAENDSNQFREIRIADYKKKDLSNLNNLSRIQLVKHKHEIESFISQIANEEKQALAIKKPLYAKKIKEWNSLLMQIENQIAVMDYQEYLRMYNNTTYESTYFEGSERKIQNFKKLMDEDSTEALFDFIHVQTKRDLAIIEKDFS